MQQPQKPLYDLLLILLLFPNPTAQVSLTCNCIKFNTEQVSTVPIKASSPIHQYGLRKIPLISNKGADKLTILVYVKVLIQMLN